MASLCSTPPTCPPGRPLPLPLSSPCAPCIRPLTNKGPLRLPSLRHQEFVGGSETGRGRKLEGGMRDGKQGLRGGGQRERRAKNSSWLSPPDPQCCAFLQVWDLAGVLDVQ